MGLVGAVAADNVGSARQTTGDRVEALLVQMTLDEKIGQMTLVEKNSIDGAADTPIDPEFWTCEPGGNGWGNVQLEYHTDRIENVVHTGGGTLTITAREEKYRTNACTSARCNTRG